MRAAKLQRSRHAVGASDRRDARTRRARERGRAIARTMCDDPVWAAHEQFGAPEVALHTSHGTVTLELYYKHAPKTCQNFFELAKRGYYDDVVFHRVIKDFMIQGGDPTGTGRGGESVFGGKFEDEISKGLRHVGAGILVMANSGPNTNKSQFFITLAPTPWLDGKHAIFGRVSSGMSVVRAIGAVKVDKNDRPVKEVKILRCDCDDKGFSWY
jgi:peptidyl-prolyl cis-trans isomerase-like 1